MIQESLFIIPNPVFSASEIHELDWLSGRLYRQTGIKIKPNDTIIQATVANWDRFGSFQKALGVKIDESIDARHKDRQIGFFAEYWPLRIFEGHKEGDCIEITSPEYGITYKLQLMQKTSRYGKISGTIITKDGGLAVAHYGEFTFERALDFVLDRGEFA